MTTDGASAAKLAVYIPLLPISIYCLFKHGKTGFFGWFFVHLFCILRIVTGGIGLHGNRSGEAYIIINSIGLSPLMLAVAGVMHEGRRATNPRLNRKLDIFLEIQFHFLVGAGMALIIVAIIQYMNDSSKSPKTLLDIGSAISCVAWAILCVWEMVALSKLRASSRNDARTVRNGKLLLYANALVLPFVALRLAYAVAYLQLLISDPSSSFISSTAIQVCLSVVPEMIVTVILLAVGAYIRNLKTEIAERDKQ